MKVRPTVGFQLDGGLMSACAARILTVGSDGGHPKLTVERISKMNDIDLLALPRKRLLLTPPGQVPKIAVLRHHFP